MSLHVEVLKAYNGDSILISFEDLGGITRNIIIDGGVPETYGTQVFQGTLRETLEKIKSKGQSIDLLIITHIDDDHIGGILSLYENEQYVSIIKSIWFNSGDIISNYFNTTLEPERSVKLFPTGAGKTSVRQGTTLEEKLKSNSNWKQTITMTGDCDTSIPCCTIKVISPDENSLRKLNEKWEKEKPSLKTSFSRDYDKTLDQFWQLEQEGEKIKLDASVPNGSSIALLLEINGLSLLMLGDAHSTVVVEALKELGYSPSNKLKLELIKLSHHGSKKNICKDLLQMVSCSKYVCSTDGTKHGLPNKSTFAKIIYYQESPVTLYFNYDIFKPIFSEEEIAKNIFTAVYLEGRPLEIS
ncbi:MBL fold metallo-hydrolase [Pontibacter sp. Tf4]|uniref:ComEC/Rec2 family competence protein n=1 Tax=Pontibacter sp. Tf4 TaxID=2761620 RepID=UPI001626CE91|nr:MBL fold metallo-hydrolase [Pontibacter sp. Tf4]MBB6610476.1 MBL fold metallo-hydrolase [Pontibacter sp. Tf4]